MRRTDRERIVAVCREGVWVPDTFQRCKAPLLNKKVKKR